MDIERLQNSPVGQLIPVQGEDARHGRFACFAFLAHPLPDDVVLDSATWTEVAQATAALAQLQQACIQLPDPRLLIRPALWREALDTSALEGTVGLLQELLEAQLPSVQFVSPETQEIRAFERVALRAFDLVPEHPISTNMLAQLQAHLFERADQTPEDVGQVRQHLVWIGEENRPIEESRFVPSPPGDQLRAGMDAWERWVQDPHGHLSPVLRAAMAHYQLETLHPFGDGNGRLGRLAVLLQLLAAGSLKYPVLTISPWLLRHRQSYQAELFDLSCTGNWSPWVRFFCRAVCEQCYVLIANAGKLLVWLDEARSRLNQRRWSGTIHQVLADLIEWPVTTITDTAIKYRVSQVHATRLIAHLEEVGVLSELTGRTYARIFGARYVMDTVESLGGPGA